MIPSFSRRKAPAAQVNNPLPPGTLLPPPSINQPCVRVAPLDGGQYTEPASLYVSPPDTSSPYAVQTIPSLPFLIQHPRTPLFNRFSAAPKPCNLLFDRGLRPDLEGYCPEVREEIEHRRPVRLPDPISKQLSRNNLTVTDIDLIALSHLHWAHTGDALSAFPSDIPIMLGPGAASLPQKRNQRFDANLDFQNHRMIRLPYPGSKGAYSSDRTHHGTIRLDWKPLSRVLPYTIDLFEDGSVFIVHLPGHAPGHFGLLCRVEPYRWVLLAGDICHDQRILTGEKSIATWRDDHTNSHGNGGNDFFRDSGIGDSEGRFDRSSKEEVCVHADKAMTEETLRTLRLLIEGQRSAGYQLEIVISHDMKWVMGNLHRFWPNCL